MHSGRSVNDCTSFTASESSCASSASGTPMLTSSIMAPPATWAWVSSITRVRSPPRSSSWNFGRPVGLIRSPMMQNGWSEPRTTSRLAERSTVCMSCPFESPSSNPRRRVRFGQTAIAARRRWIRSLARRTAVEASAAYPSAPTASAYSWVTGAPPDHDDHLVAQAGLLQSVDVRLEHGHRRGEEGRHPDDVRLVLLDRRDELLRCHLHTQVDHVEPGALQHDVDQVLADVVDVALHRAHHERADGFGTPSRPAAGAAGPARHSSPYRR